MLASDTRPDPAAAQSASALLRGSFLFAGLEEDLLCRIIDLAVSKRYANGELLFSKGDEADGLLAVASGQVRISVLSAAGKEILLNLLGPGEIFGEIGLLDGRPRTANAVAKGPLDVVLLRRRDFLPLLDKSPDLSRHIVALLCERLRWTSALIEDAAFLDLEGRLAKRLLLMADSYGRPVPAGVRIELRLSQQDLGQMVDASREKVNRRLQGLRQRGVIEIDDGYVVITDRRALERLANGADLA